MEEHHTSYPKSPSAVVMFEWDKTMLSKNYIWNTRTKEMGGILTGHTCLTSGRLVSLKVEEEGEEATTSNQVAINPS